MKYAAIAILLVIIPASSPMPGKAATSSGQSGDKAKNQSQHNHDDSAPPLAATKSNQPTFTKSEPGKTASQNEEKSVNLTRLPPITIAKEEKSWEDHLFDWGPWVFNLFLFVVGALQVGLLCGTLRTLKRQTKATEDAATAALRSAKVAVRSMNIFIERERPRITIEVERLSLSPTYTNPVRYTIVCCCPTKALIKDSAVALYIDSGVMPKPPEYRKISIPKIIPETTKIPDSISFHEKTDQSVINQINEGKLIVHFRGFIKYRGIHLSDQDASYETSVNYKWMPDPNIDPKFPGVDESDWQEDGEPEDNKNT